MNRDFDLLDFEHDLWQKQMANGIHRPMQVIDENWQKLKEERSLEPEPPRVTIDKITNANIMLWSNVEYTKGNFSSNVYRDGQKEDYNKNLLFSVAPDLTAKQYKVWDLVLTDAHLSECTARKAKFYQPGHADQPTNEFAHFEIWKNHRLLWACLLVEDYIIPMRIFQTHSDYDQSGNIKLTAAWNNRCDINQWYQQNI